MWKSFIHINTWNKNLRTRVIGKRDRFECTNTRWMYKVLHNQVSKGETSTRPNSNSHTKQRPSAEHSQGSRRPYSKNFQDRFRRLHVHSVISNVPIGPWKIEGRKRAIHVERSFAKTSHYGVSVYAAGIKASVSLLLRGVSLYKLLWRIETTTTSLSHRKRQPAKVQAAL